MCKGYTKLIHNTKEQIFQHIKSTQIITKYKPSQPFLHIRRKVVNQKR